MRLGNKSNRENQKNSNQLHFCCFDECFCFFMGNKIARIFAVARLYRQLSTPDRKRNKAVSIVYRWKVTDLDDRSDSVIGAFALFATSHQEANILFMCCIYNFFVLRAPITDIPKAEKLIGRILNSILRELEAVRLLFFFCSRAQFFTRIFIEIVGLEVKLNFLSSKISHLPICFSTKLLRRSQLPYAKSAYTLHELRCNTAACEKRLAI